MSANDAFDGRSYRTRLARRSPDFERCRIIVIQVGTISDDYVAARFQNPFKWVVNDLICPDCQKGCKPRIRGRQCLRGGSNRSLIQPMISSKGTPSIDGTEKNLSPSHIAFIAFTAFHSFGVDVAMSHTTGGRRKNIDNQRGRLSYSKQVGAREDRFSDVPVGLVTLYGRMVAVTDQTPRGRSAS